MQNLTEPRIVAGVRGCGDEAAVLDLAAAEARLRGLPLLLLSVHPEGPPSTGPTTLLTATLRRACVTWPDLAVTGRNVTAGPAATTVDQLVAASESATLLVVGQDRPGAERSGVVTAGKIAALVAAHAAGPTVVVPPGAAPALDAPVLLAVGLSPEDELTTGFAFEEAARRRVPLVAVHVWSGDPGTALGSVNPFAYDLRRAEAAADRMLAESLAGWCEKFPDVTVRRTPLYDANPAATLRDAAQELAGLVVVGARRNAPRRSQLLGSVTSSLLRTASRPVAVVGPAHGARLSPI